MITTELRAKLVFLKLFTLPKQLEEVNGSERWQRILGNTLQSAASQLIEAGMLQKGDVDITALLELKSKKELQSLAKARGISQSGTKELLAQRLFGADADGMSQLFCGKTYFVCTHKGRVIIDKFIASEQELGLKAETASQSALRRRCYKDACKIVADFEASQPFPRGIGIDWCNYDPTHDAEMLNEIAAYSPQRYSRMPENILASLRICAGMMNLWGQSDPVKWLTDSERQFAREARMMWFAASSKVRLKELRRAGIQRVQLLSSGRDDACETCKEAGGRIYPINSAPELPHSECTCEFGCGCILVAIAASEAV